MEIRNRLTLQFSLIVALLLAAILGFNYYLAYIFAKESYFDRLRERALTIAEMQLDQDENNRTRFDAINRKYKQILNGEMVQIYDQNRVIRYQENSSEFPIPLWVKQELLDQKQDEILIDDRYYIQIRYVTEDDKFIILASARDVVGSSKLRYMVQTMVVSFLLFLGLVVLLGRFLARKALQPMREVMSQVSTIGFDSLEKRVYYRNDKDEIAQLAQTFNLMLDRLEDAFKAQSGFVRNASHELRNPLAAMIGQSEVTLNKPREPEYYQEVLRAILQEALRLKHIVNSLLQLSQASPSAVRESLEVIRLDELLLDIVEKLSSQNRSYQIEIRLPENPESELLFTGNRSLLEVAIGNLVENACKYSEGKTVHCLLEKKQENTILKIIDEGIGMTETDIKFFTEPFYRSSRVRAQEGFGIGMAISSKILQIHGIPMTVQSELNKGTRITLEFGKGISEVAVVPASK